MKLEELFCVRTLSSATEKKHVFRESLSILCVILSKRAAVVVNYRVFLL